uniref:Uncharacterized protein n=1 Tax=Manihot esculenta TaxID=3983 RepID=A0A2C9VTN4_MANES
MVREALKPEKKKNEKVQVQSVQETSRNYGQVQQNKPCNSTGTCHSKTARIQNILYIEGNVLSGFSLAGSSYECLGSP